MVNTSFIMKIKRLIRKGIIKMAQKLVNGHGISQMEKAKLLDTLKMIYNKVNGFIIFQRVKFLTRLVLIVIKK